MSTRKILLHLFMEGATGELRLELNLERVELEAGACERIWTMKSLIVFYFRTRPSD